MTRTAQRPDDPELERYLAKAGKEVKARRELTGLSQQASADVVGIPVGALRDIEQGYDARFSYHYLNAKHLGLAFGYGLSEDIAKELTAIKDVLQRLGERMDRLGEGLAQLVAALTERR